VYVLSIITARGQGEGGRREGSILDSNNKGRKVYDLSTGMARGQGEGAKVHNWTVIIQEERCTLCQLVWRECEGRGGDVHPMPLHDDRYDGQY
jgi:hypothetical protein